MDTAARGQLHGPPGGLQFRSLNVRAEFVSARVSCTQAAATARIARAPSRCPESAGQDVSFYLLQAGAKSSKTSRQRIFELSLHSVLLDH